MYQSQFVFVDNRDFPAGPAAFAILSQTNRLNIVCTAVCIIGGWLQDALLVGLVYFGQFHEDLIMHSCTASASF